MLSAVGDNRLLPKPEVDSLVINVGSGQRRANHSWILSRLLRDFDYWMHPECQRVQDAELQRLLAENQKEWQIYKAGTNVSRKQQRPRDPADIRIGLRVTVWQGEPTTGKGCGDLIYWIGLPIAAGQLCIATIPWILYGAWFTFYVTAGGTSLAYASSSLPQWCTEKIGVRALHEPKDILLTEGNGAAEVVLILGCRRGLDLEALAAPQRELRRAWVTRIASLVLAGLWIMLLVSVAGWEEQSWYLLGIRLIGILHNIAVAGVKRQPQAFGIALTYRSTIVKRRVMEVLFDLENRYPQAGIALLGEFFPASPREAREKRLWESAAVRAKAWKESHRPDLNDPRNEAAWHMPPVERPDDKENYDDIPTKWPRP